jgi:hypothetical protein
MQVWDNSNSKQCPRCGTRLNCDVCGEKFATGEVQVSILAYPNRITGHQDCVAGLAAPASPSSPLMKIAEPEGDDYTPPSVMAQRDTEPPPYEDWETKPPVVYTDGHTEYPQPPQEPGDDGTELAPAVADYLRELGLL